VAEVLPCIMLEKTRTVTEATRQDSEQSSQKSNLVSDEYNSDSCWCTNLSDNKMISHNLSLIDVKLI
jgi:hypothetical protein